MNFDYLLFTFWSITYFLIIFYGIKFKKNYFPTFAVILNFSWEVVSFIYDIKTFPSLTFFIHLVWLLLDVIIIVVQITKCKCNFITYLFVIPLIFIFLSVFTFENGQLVLSFFIDIIMAILFIIQLIFNKSNNYIHCMFIGISKLLGDLFAWLTYRYNPIVNVIGVIVLFINSIYIIYSFHKTK